LITKTEGKKSKEHGDLTTGGLGGAQASPAQASPERLQDEGGSGGRLVSPQFDRNDRFTRMIKKWVDQFAQSLNNTDIKNFIELLILDPFIKYIMSRIFPYIIVMFCLFALTLIMVILIFILILMRPPVSSVSSISLIS